MPVSKKALVTGGIIGGIALLFSRRSHAKGPSKGKCHPFPKIRTTKVLQVAEEAIDEGMRGVERVAAHVGETLFPTDPQTQKPVGWPKQAPFALPVNATEHAECLYAELILIIGTNLDVPEDPAQPDSPAKVFNDLISSEPVPDKFWKVKKGWTAAKMARTALNAVQPGLGEDGQARLQYIKCLPRSGWNANYYAAPESARAQWSAKTQNNWPPMYSADGQSIWPAFMPWHQDAIHEIVNGRMPERRITDAGLRVQGGTYGLLWLPSLDGDALAMGEVACVDVDPPLKLTELLS